jgi:ribosome-binding ATPase YchF (GTP1/OBG family)
LILVVAAAFSKFLVIDRLAEVDAARAEVNRLQMKIDQGYEELAGFDDLADLYAHYTYSGFTQEELNRSDRVEVLRLIRSVVLPRTEVSSWTLSGNTLTINLNGETLQDINLLVQQLEAEDIVDFCTVNTANTKDNARLVLTENLGPVKARVMAYLNAGTEVDNG